MSGQKKNSSQIDCIEIERYQIKKAFVSKVIAYEKKKERCQGKKYVCMQIYCILKYKKMYQAKKNIFETNRLRTKK